jgi:hypothetical protein
MKTLFHQAYLLTLFGMIASGGILAQSDVVSTGGNASSAAGTVSYTVGQNSANILDAPGHSIYEGVQQPYELFVVSITSDQDKGLSVEVFPNPTSTNLILRILSPEFSSTTRYSITDVNGILRTSQVFAGDEIMIPMMEYSAGTYFLTLFQGETTVHQFKILKL